MDETPKLTAKLKKASAENSATLTMPTPAGSCGGADCTNAPTVSIGSLRLCDACVEHARQHYPASFTAYWAPKMVLLTDTESSAVGEVTAA